ncbi:MAG: M24 family metallopeptidase [Gammaproteobacteria bacterium]|jgi:Xaa-Pro aminopeptidase|nr:M24 family metallopeptidase [Gammaproteobacteria bacterium]
MSAVQGFSITTPKIDPSRPPRQGRKPDGTPDDDDRVEIGPTDLAFQEWAALGLAPPNLEGMRQEHLQRVCRQLQTRDYGGILLFDPLNIRYATDCSNMHLWIAHNPARAVFVSADGYVILWDFHHCGHLSAHLPLVSEVRDGAGFFYFLAGDSEEQQARQFANEVDDALRQHAGRNRRLAIDKMEISGIQAVQKLGIEIKSGQQVMEHARLVKSENDIRAMRCALATCEIAVDAMGQALTPGIAEVELWSVLHAENIKRGGEWIETRILSSGPRTNPWMQEAGPRKIREGELVAFDTDLIGPYGYCADISRTWYCGDDKPSDEQRRLYQLAHEHMTANMNMLAPGVSFRELTEKGHRLPEKFRAQRYGVMGHGVGLCDEFPAIYYPEDFVDGAFDYIFEPGMTMCVEVYIGEVGAKEGVKLEDQVLITETGVENLTRCPFDERLMA